MVYGNMTSILSAIPNLSDGDLLAQLERSAAQERDATAQFIALLMEVDARKLYAQQSCSSLFTYCVQVLHFSEHAAYLRIEAARTARRFPVILERLTDGSLHLTAVSLLAPHLTAANHRELLDAATHKTKREIEQVVAGLRPQPDVPALIRKLPAPVAASVSASALPMLRPLPANEESPCAALTAPPARTATTVRPPEIKPLAPERFKVQFTVSRETYEKLRCAQDLLRHAIPTGDPAAIFDRALSLLLADLSKTKFAAVSRPRADRKAKPGSRHVPAGIKRNVWRRDGGQCAFRGERGRCGETGFLEFHHLVPFAKGGATITENLELRCRAHNAYEAEQEFRSTSQPFCLRETSPAYGIDRVWT